MQMVSIAQHLVSRCKIALSRGSCERCMCRIFHLTRTNLLILHSQFRGSSHLPTNRESVARRIANLIRSTAGRGYNEGRLHAAAKPIEEAAPCSPGQPALQAKSRSLDPETFASPATLRLPTGSALSQTPGILRHCLSSRAQRKGWKWADDPSHGVQRHSLHDALVHSCVTSSTRTAKLQKSPNTYKQDG